MSKVTAALTAGVLFFLVSSPMLYNAVDSLLSSFTSFRVSQGGCPTTHGLLVHSAVFAGVVYLMMRHGK